MTTLEDLEDEDVYDFLQVKGSGLDPFKIEYSELERELNTLAAESQAKEREYDAYMLELSGLREQNGALRRAIDETVSSKETLKEAVDLMVSKRDNLAENERADRQEIIVFKGHFEELKAALSIGADWQPEQLEQRNILEKERDFILSKYENKQSQVNGIRGDIERLYQYIQQQEEEIERLTKQKDDALIKIGKFSKDALDAAKAKEDIEKLVFELRNNVIKGEMEITEKTRMLKTEETSLVELDLSIKKTKDQMEQYIKEYDDLFNILQELTTDLDKQKVQNKKATEEIAIKEVQIEEKTKENEHLAKELSKVTKLRDAVVEKCNEVEEEKKKAEEKRDQLNRQIYQVGSVDVNILRRDIESQEKQLSSMKQEDEVLRKKHIGSDKAAKVLQDLLQFNLNGKKNLLIEQRLLEEEVGHFKEQIRMLVLEKERFEHDIELANQQYYTALEELKLQELQIQELQRKTLEDQTKLKHKQNLYEAVRSDRNLYSKQLVESQEEIGELRRKFRAMNHSIDQLKDEISGKDHAIVKEHFLHHTVDKERELLKNELTKIRKQLQSSESIIDNQRVEVVKLNRITEEGEEERSRQRNELAAVIAERNLLTSQVIKRNMELNVLYDRIKAHRGSLHVGERQYVKIVENIARWQDQLRSLVRSQNEVMAGLAGSEQMRNYIIQLEREILTEQTKSRALFDELEKPMNVHRWRILESSDPKRFEKITQIQSLQKQLIAKSDEVIKLDLMIQEKEKVYAELKNIISRQPGPEIDEQMLVYQQTLKDKVKQLAAMEEELQMYRQQIKIFKEDISGIEGRLTGLKKQWFKQKKREMTKRLEPN